MTIPQQVPSSPSCRVLYIDSSVGFGGAVKSLALTLRGLDDVEKWIFTSQDPDIVKTWFPTLPVSSFRRVINYRTNERFLSAAGTGFFRTIAAKIFAVADIVESLRNSVRLAAVIRRQKIDLIHLNNGFLPTEAALAARMTGVKCVVHMRGFQESRVHPRWAPQVSRVIAVSGPVADSLGTDPISPSIVTVVHDPVDLELVQEAAAMRDSIRAQWKIDANEIAVGIFGRVIPWKGQLEFVRAMIPVMLADSRVKGLIVGDESDGARSYFEAIQGQISAAGLKHRFVLAGYRENVEEYYAAADIVVHASIAPEPFGMVVGEAMAASRPVIAADAGGPREVVEHGVDGLLVKPGDVDALADAIRSLASDGALRERMGTAGAAKAGRRFTLRRNADQISAIYAEALGHSDHQGMSAGA